MKSNYKFKFFTLEDEASNTIWTNDDSLEKFEKNRGGLKRVGELVKTGKKTPQGHDVFECEFEFSGVKVLSMSWSQQRHFADINLDFTIPKGEDNAGLPLLKSCLIGANGSGKSTILNQLQMSSRGGYFSFNTDAKRPSNCSTKLTFEGNKFDYQGAYTPFGQLDILSVNGNNTLEPLTEDDFKDRPAWKRWRNKYNLVTQENLICEEVLSLNKHLNRGPLTGLSILAPDEYTTGAKSIGMKPTLNELLNAKKQLNSSMQTIGHDTVQNFWAELVYLVQKRASDFNKYLESESKKDPSISYIEMKSKFEIENPPFLSYLSDLWNEILNLAGLTFNPSFFSSPETLSDKINYYFSYVNTPDVQLQFDQLSGGLKNYLLKIGHISSLWFERDIPSSFLFLDEPDSGLFPGYVENLVEKYQDISQGAQLFVATHNPQIARQFKPYERYSLNINDENRIECKRGILKEGFNIERYLIDEFNVANYYSGETKVQYMFYQYLVTKLSTAKGDEKLKVATEISKIKNIYGF